MRQGRVIILFRFLGEGQSPYVCWIAKIGQFQEMIRRERVNTGFKVDLLVIHFPYARHVQNIGVKNVHF